MGKLVIQYHDFEKAKKEIKKFSEQTKTDLDLKKVEDYKDIGEFFGDWFCGRGIGLDHVVRGEELNELTSQIQTHLHSVNDTQIKLIREFGQVYRALEALDRDYIQAILVSINATDETSKSTQEAQRQIRKIVENQKKTLEELKKFKQKLDGYAHLGDVDSLWQSIEEHTSQLTKSRKRDEQLLAIIQNNKDEVDKKLADALQTEKNTFEELKELKKFKQKLEDSAHLWDVNSLWQSIEKHTSQLTESRKRDEKLVATIQNNKDEVDKKLADALQTANTAIESLTKKIKYVYWIAGGSAGLAIIELILLLMKVI